MKKPPGEGRFLSMLSPVGNFAYEEYYCAQNGNSNTEQSPTGRCSCKKCEDVADDGDIIREIEKTGKPSNRLHKKGDVQIIHNPKRRNRRQWYYADKGRVVHSLLVVISFCAWYCGADDKVDYQRVCDQQNNGEQILGFHMKAGKYSVKLAEKIHLVHENKPCCIPVDYCEGNLQNVKSDIKDDDKGNAKKNGGCYCTNIIQNRHSFPNRN